VHSTENAPQGARQHNAHGEAHPSRSREFAGAVFLSTVADWKQLPKAGAPEVAFAGRSNAGKSSAINALVGHGGLARVSRSPGRTQHLNFFQLRAGALLVDLPGYGYAAASWQARNNWGHLVTRYLSARSSLVGLVLVADSRRPLTQLDHQLLNWFLPTGRPVRILLTKADKLIARERVLALARAQETLARVHPDRTRQLSAQLFSSSRQWGVADAAATIREWLDRSRSLRQHKKKGPGIKGSDTGPKTPSDR
jgi:GTP-binding protein